MRPCAKLHADFKPGCPLCEWCKVPEYAVKWGEKVWVPDPRAVRREAAQQRLQLSCVHLGGPTGEKVKCPSCRGNVEVDLFRCAVHGKCSTHKKVDGAQFCMGCKERSTLLRNGRGLPYRLVQKFDETNLEPGAKGKRFNPSLIPFGGNWLLAYRDGWAGSDIHVVRLARDSFAPLGPAVKLSLHHAQARYGREDPRLFWLGGALHVAFAGVMAKPKLHTNVLFARLSNDLKVEDIFYPEIAGRKEWEKNHAYFDHGGNLYAVYTIQPHRIMQVWGNEMEWRWQTGDSASREGRLAWNPGTEMRGGASPVRVGEEYWHFFHSRSARRVYCTGLYTFEAQPPFRPLRILPDLLDEADPATKPADQYCPVVFVGGAVRHDAEWVLATGVHDRYSELRAFKHEDLESRLVRVP